MNGVLASEASTGSPANSSGLLTFGRGGDFPGEYFGGLIDEVRVSSVAVYTTAFTPPTAPLSSTADTVGLWHFDEGSGQTAADSSGNGRTGILGNNSGSDSADPTWSSDSPVSGSELSPIASFSASPLSGTVPLTVSFANNSSNAASYTWNFGDGTSSTTISPTHIYPQAGLFTVILAAGDGTITNTLTRTHYIQVMSEAAGSSLAFDGANNMVRTVDLPLLSEFTLEAWVKRMGDFSRHETFLSDANSGYGQSMFTLFVDGGSTDCDGPTDQFAYYQINGDFEQCSGVAADLGTWHHLAISRDSSGTQRFFVDGILTGTANNAPNVANSSGLLTFGRGGDYPGEYFGGLIDEVRISNSALYTTTFSPPTTPLDSTANTVGLWHLDEGSGQTAADSSGNGRNGVLGDNSESDSTDPAWSTDSPVSNSAAPVADFVATPLSGPAPLTVTFSNSSTNASNYIWNFGDSATSTAISPTHVYTQAGVYSVILAAGNGAVTHTLTHTNYITVAEAVVADFSAFPLTGTVPLMVQFFDNSTGATSYEWAFGDGLTATLPSPTHTYTTAGVYTVTLTVVGPGGSDTLARSNYITASEILEAGFSAFPLTGTVPLTVQFFDNSTGATSYEWAFGDGLTSTLSSPTHTYAATGVYTVTLTVGNGQGFDTLARLDYITAFEPVIAGFAASPLTGSAPLTVTFSNNSTGATAYLWDFGMGATLGVISPTYTYNQPGVYTVTLTVSGPGGTNTLSQANYITVPEPVLALFSVAPLTGTAPLTVTFNNSSTGASTYGWDFGDGTTDTTASPTHTYTQAGIYTVTLSASDGQVTDTLPLTNAITVYEPVFADFAATPLTGLVPLTVTFVNSSTGATDYLWEFGNGATLTVISPTYTYDQPGVYTVTLTATGPGGSDALTQINYITVTAPIIRDWAVMTTTTTLPIRGEHSMAYDNTRNVLVLYGGNAIGWPYEDTTWEFDGTDWNIIPTALSPAARYGTSLAYDPLRQVMVLFGGGSQSDRALNQTWEYTNTEWINVSPATSPLSRTYASLAANPSSGTIYLFGGNEHEVYFNDLWRYEAGNWTEITPTGDIPPARTLAAMTFQPSNLPTSNRLLLFGGRTVTGTLLADLWAFDPVSAIWTELDYGSGEGPAARMAHSLTYDPDTGKVVLVGGITNGGDTRLGDTWHFLEGDWTEADPATPLPPRAYHQAVYTDNAILLFSGRQLWRYE